MDLVETERLMLRRVTDDDAAFLVALLNDPGWLAGIGDRGVRTEADARAYARERLHACHARHGFSMLAVTERASGRALGLCGLIRRDTLDDVDLGYAFLPEGRGRGLAFEAAGAVLERAHREHGLTRVVAITLPANRPSVALLERLGFRLERAFVDPESGDTLSLYGNDAAVAAFVPTADALDALARESEREGYRFLSRLAGRLGGGAGRYDGPGESFLGAWHGRVLVGVCALQADPYVVGRAALAPPGRLRHLYVHPAHRRRGLATRLARRALDRAAPRFADVRLRAADTDAAAFHERLGFVPIEEPDATHRLSLREPPSPRTRRRHS